jgi:hypothetical protein
MDCSLKENKLGIMGGGLSEVIWPKGCDDCELGSVQAL